MITGIMRNQQTDVSTLTNRPRNDFFSYKDSSLSSTEPDCLVYHCVYTDEFPTISTIPSSLTSAIWLDRSLRSLQDIAELPEDWDDYGSPSIDVGVIRAAAALVGRLVDLQGEKYLDWPLPHVAPIQGGTLQFEWRVGSRYFEIEFLDQDSVGFLFMDGSSIIEKGVQSHASIENLRSLLDRLVR